MAGQLERIALRYAREAGQHGSHRLDRRVVGAGLVERGQHVVDKNQLGVAVADASACGLHENVE